MRQPLANYFTKAFGDVNRERRLAVYPSILPGNLALFGQITEDLLHEERISFRLLLNGLDQFQ